MPRRSDPVVPGAWTPPPRESAERPSTDRPSPPRTPPPRSERAGNASSKSNGNTKGGPAAARGTMAPSVTGSDDARDPTSAAGEARARSDSHDLSWSPHRQRRSVLENMLLSLDHAAGNEPLVPGPPLSAGRAALDAGPDLVSPSTAAAARALRGHSFSALPRTRDRSDTGHSSLSFYSPALESQSPPPPPTRGHRSNSSLTFQPGGLGRIDSVRNAPPRRDAAAAAPAAASSVVDEADVLAVTPHDPPVSAVELRRASHDSAGSSLEPRPSSDGRWQSSHKRRSRSFDQGLMRSDPFAALDRRAFLFASAEDQATATAIYDSLEAAPMPTVPGGPRRYGESVQFTQADPGDAGSASRRGSLRSPIGLFSRSERSQSPKRGGDPRADRVERPSNLRHGSSYDDAAAHPPDGVDLPDHPSSPLGAATPGSGPARQGFFRRVFGSGKPVAAAADPALPASARAMSESASAGLAHIDRMVYGSVPDGAQYPPPPMREVWKTRKADKDKEAPPLNKKPSFFRRRKKSLSQAQPPLPDQPPQLNSNLPANRVAADARDQTASPSSLWNALDPYLAGSQGYDPDHGGRSSYEEPQHERTPSESTKRATIRPVQRPEQPDLLVADSPRNKDARPSQDAQLHKSPGNRAKDLTIKVEPRGTEAAANGAVPAHLRKVSDVDKTLPNTPTTAARQKVASATKSSPKSAGSKTKRRSQDMATGTPLSSAKKPSATTPGSGRIPASTPSAKAKGKDVEMDSQQQQQLWTVPDATLQAPTKPPPPPPTSPSVAKTQAMGGFPPAATEETSDVNTTASQPLSPAESSKAAPDPGDDDDDDDDVAISDEPLDEDEPTPEDQEYAQKLFGGLDGLDRGDAAAWLGEEGDDRRRARKAYMRLFDWTNMSILGAMRSFCSQTRLKGETQQVDRVLDALSSRWCECNPKHGFKATDVVHTICYSILLLNTDLHLANIESKMTRTQFIRNTMPTIRRVVADAAPHAFQDHPMAPQAPTRPPPAVPTEGSADATRNASMQRPNLLQRPSYQSDSETANSGPGTPTEGPEGGEDCGPLVTVPFSGKQITWELQVETVLKNFYNAIRQERLFLYGSEAPRTTARSQPSSNSLGALGGTPLRRSNSMVSRAGSENVALRSRLLDGRFGSRWTAKGRGRSGLYGATAASSHAQSSRTSFDDDAASAISPSATSMWSRVSFGRTQASMSVNSFSMLPAAAEFPPSIGFANALSQAIIREEAIGDPGEDSLRARPLLEDESLELAGAPWAKEGMLKHKHHLEAVDKKARDRSWAECFAVVEKGWMRLFQFGGSNTLTGRALRPSRARPAKPAAAAGAVVGGGNWTENAEPLGAYLLRQSIATALPPPGYSKARPHVWALSLPSGAVHLFQAGTPEIVREFVSTVNYWSARMSKEPLVGGVSNIEYGWSDAVVNLALLQQSSQPPPPAPHDPRASSVSTAPPPPRPSIQSSIRTSIDQSAPNRPRLPADRITIHDWAPPMQSTMPSQLLPVDQLRALEQYVANIEGELQRHNELHRPMLFAYTPRSPNYAKAMSNWERKSSYLLQEIVKFSTYIESLRTAHALQDKVLAERSERDKEKEREGAKERAMDHADGPAPVEAASG